jgi:choline dehydrogenase-like flavoprotein
MVDPTGETFDYVVVGSGAGGGTAAARLAEAGMSVLVIEAGADPSELEAAGLPENYAVPAFHPFASENKAMAWNFRVHDFGDDAFRRPGADAWGARGVLYPRASTLGGCTAHNAMILMAPHDSDWNAIAKMTGDETWRSDNMRKYFRRLENCRYRPLWRILAQATFGLVNPTGHGWNGWLQVERPLPPEAFGDHPLMCVIRNAIHSDLFGEGQSWFAPVGQRLRRFSELMARIVIGEEDPNDCRAQDRLAEGLSAVPLSTFKGRRRGARERVLDATRRHGLRIAFDTLATRVLFNADRRAIGVEYQKGRNLYGACAEPATHGGASGKVFARREVILAAGAFNSPQLLMLSGVGPAGELMKHGIAPLVSLEGVGRNLQDRYEIGIVHKTKAPWTCLKGAEFKVGDPIYRAWERGRGMYPSNGAAAAFSLRSRVAREAGTDSDLFVMALLTRFYGYFTGYSDIIRESRSDLTFAILKAHTMNRAGSVTLASGNPRTPPRIDFRGFEEGTDRAGTDLAAVIEGVERVRAMAAAIGDQILEPEDTPGPEFLTRDNLSNYIRTRAWGHHASCTCHIGPEEKGGVLTSDFRVHGTQGLRVVDASVFPRIPGFFIVGAIYMIAEKAADVILDPALART